MGQPNAGSAAQPDAPISFTVSLKVCGISPRLALKARCALMVHEKDDIKIDARDYDWFVALCGH